METDLLSHFEEVLAKKDLGVVYDEKKIQSYMKHNTATISLLKGKYDELRDDIEEMKSHMTKTSETETMETSVEITSKTNGMLFIA